MPKEERRDTCGVSLSKSSAQWGPFFVTKGFLLVQVLKGKGAGWVQHSIIKQLDDVNPIFSTSLSGGLLAPLHPSNTKGIICHTTSPDNWLLGGQTSPSYSGGSEHQGPR